MFMTNAVEIAQINMALEFFGAVLSLLMILFMCFNLPKRKSKQDKIFVAVLLCNALVLACDASAWAFRGALLVENRFLENLVNIMVFALGYVLMALYTYYFYSFLTTKSGNVIRFPMYIVITVTAVALLALLVTVHFNSYFSISVNYHYERQNFYWTDQLFGCVGTATNAYMLVRYRKRLSQRERTMFAVYSFMPLAAMLFQLLFYGIALLYLTICIVSICTYMLIQSEQYIQQELELEKSRNANMLSQIQPHFVFNTLNSISALCLTDPRKADDAIVRFSEYLRENIEWLDNDSPIDFARELTHLQNYIAIETMRFGDRLNMVYDIKFSDFVLPPLTVQPLVENAIKHGITQKPQGGTVLLRTRKEGDTAVVTIIDDGDGFDPSCAGEGSVGLKNVRFRLAFVGGTLKIVSHAGEGTAVEIVIPLKGGERK